MTVLPDGKIILCEQVHQSDPFVVGDADSRREAEAALSKLHEILDKEVPLVTIMFGVDVKLCRKDFVHPSAGALGEYGVKYWGLAR